MLARLRTIVTKHKYSIILCVLFAFFYVLPLLIANVYYTDDMRRSLTGLGWKYDGRHFASFMMSKLTGGGRISDFFPYSIIFSAVIFALTGYLISLILRLETKSRLKFSALIFLINPFLLENLSYRWDSLPMAISVCAVVVPFLFIDSWRRFSIASLIGITITMFTYQASVVVFPLLAVLILIKKCLDGDDLSKIGRLTLVMFCAFVLSLVVYKIVSVFLPVLSQGERGVTVFGAEKPFNELLRNTLLSWHLIKDGFSRYFTILAALSALLAIWAYIRFSKSSERFINKALILPLVVVVFILMPSVLLFLKDSWIVPRVLIGFPFIVYLLLLFIARWEQKIISVLSILFVFVSLPLISSYAGALKSQHSLEVSVVEKITQTIDVDNKTIVFNGELQYSPETYVALEKYPLLVRLVPSYLKDDWMWGEMVFNKATNYMYAPKFVYGEERRSLLEKMNSLPIVGETYYYTLRADSTSIVVDFQDARINRQ